MRRPTALRCALIALALSAAAGAAPRAIWAAWYDTSSSIEELRERIAALPAERISKKKAILQAQLGTLLYRDGEMQRASDALEAALENKTTGAMRRHIYLYLGKSYESSGRLDKAIDAYERAVEYDRKNWRRHRDLARLYEQAKLYRRAVSSYLEAMRRNSGEPGVPFALGRTWRKIGLYEEAELYLLASADMGHDAPAVAAELSSILEGQGRFGEAAREWERAIGPDARVEEWARLVYLAALVGDKALIEKGMAGLRSAQPDAATLNFYENLVELLPSNPERTLSLQFAGPTVRALAAPLLPTAEGNLPKKE